MNDTYMTSLRKACRSSPKRIALSQCPRHLITSFPQPKLLSYYKAYFSSLAGYFISKSCWLLYFLQNFFFGRTRSSVITDLIRIRTRCTMNRLPTIEDADSNLTISKILTNITKFSQQTHITTIESSQGLVCNWQYLIARIEWTDLPIRQSCPKTSYQTQFIHCFAWR